jgi:hypothetical protein
MWIFIGTGRRLEKTLLRRADALRELDRLGLARELLAAAP